jgi:D-alanyl-D-alanine dipeptidase
MGCPPNTDNELSFLHNDMITEAQHQNRMTLLEAMLEAGFAPNPFEWWHFQYGETYWAAFYGEKQTKYDSIKV